MFKFLLLSFLGLLVAALGSYISARILLPDMGLTVPDFGKFFWAAFFVVICGVIVSAIGYLVNRL